MQRTYSPLLCSPTLTYYHTVYAASQGVQGRRCCCRWLLLERRSFFKHSHMEFITTTLNLPPRMDRISALVSESNSRLIKLLKSIQKLNVVPVLIRQFISGNLTVLKTSIYIRIYICLSALSNVPDSYYLRTWPLCLLQQANAWLQ